MIRQMGQSIDSTPIVVDTIECSDDLEEDEGSEVGDMATMPTVQLSARNILKAKVKRIIKGTVSAEVTLAIAPGVELVSIVTRASADKLGLQAGKDVFAVIKSNSVMIAAG